MVNIAVIIPALNEEGNIHSLVSDLHGLNMDGVALQVIVVDNSSSDRTAQEASSAGARVIHEQRRGYGYACAAGVEAAETADVLVFLDGDRSSLPSELPGLILPILRDEADLVLGSRDLGNITREAMPIQQKFGNLLASRLINILYRLPLTDLGPFRAIKRSLLLELGMQEMSYGWQTEMTVKSAQKGARIKEVPVSWHPRLAGQSKVSGTLRGTILAAWYILGVTLRYALIQPNSSNRRFER